MTRPTSGDFYWRPAPHFTSGAWNRKVNRVRLCQRTIVMGTGPVVTRVVPLIAVAVTVYRPGAGGR